MTALELERLSSAPTEALHIKTLEAPAREAARARLTSIIHDLFYLDLLASQAVEIGYKLDFTAKELEGPTARLMALAERLK